MIALLAPGQGSQAPGMLTSWLELDGVAARIERYSAASGLDLARLGTAAEAEEITDTAIAQPLIVTATLLGYEHSGQLPADGPTAGHSVGELAAAAIAGVIGEEDAVALAAARGREMAAACALEPTGMAAVMGGEQAELLDALPGLDLIAANQNGAGQLVVAGALDKLEQLAEQRPGGVRVKQLQVAGAFHTKYMAPAQEAFAAHAEQVEVRDPVRPLLSNLDGTVVSSGDEFRRRLIEQITAPVRWDLCMETLGAQGISAAIEFPPAGPLTGLIKRTLKEVARFQMKQPDAEGIAEFVRVNA
ncbi:ACP S-malonyltransferase [Sciscionella marina]|uniref:ACP S-malonyltransferase n=1 Tax=Sciscionella marina TaxID=508770 RepID=UPI000A04E1C3|nr:ACP S-malonyltransferase [Sciscionella marina]